MAHEFRPYIMFTNQDNYKTDIVNTDRLGFRKTFYNDNLVGIDELQDLIKAGASVTKIRDELEGMSRGAMRELSTAFQDLVGDTDGLVKKLNDAVAAQERSYDRSIKSIEAAREDGHR